MKKAIRILGSLSFALWLIASLVVVLTVSTLLESAHGTPFAQRYFYQAGWFDVYLALFGINIFCASLSRWPYKKYHTGFMVVHAGILMILVGSFFSRYGGVDGQIALFEQESGSRIFTSGYELVTHLPDKSINITKLQNTSALRHIKLSELEPGVNVVLQKVIHNAVVDENITEGDKNSPENLGIKISIKSDMAGAHETFSLFQNHPSNPQANKISLGAAVFELLSQAPVEEKEPQQPITKPQLRLTFKETGKTYSWPLDPMPTKDMPVGNTGLTLKNIRFFPDARVNEEKELISVSNQPNNPAVEITLTDNKGKEETHTRFVLFPDFESLHGREKDNLFHVAVDLDIPGMEKMKSKRPTGLQFFVKNGQWIYRSHNSKNIDQEGFLEVGKEYSAGWMDFKFKVEKLYNRAEIHKKIRAGSSDPSENKVDLAVELAVEKDGEIITSNWVMANDNMRLETPSGALVAVVRQTTDSIPFTLTLKDFRKVDYPGTSQAQSYESDVALEDKKDGIKIEKTIRMNQPLDYKGYRIFQSSFSQDPEQGETSVFTVAKNPGIYLIYSGSIVLVLGIIMVFYIKPLSSFGGRGITYASKKR